MPLTSGFGVYAIENTVTGKVYVGSTARGFRQRRNEHWSRLAAGTHGNPILQASWNAHGPAAFRVRVLEVVNDPARVVEREQAWIDAVAAAGLCFNVGPAQPSRFGVPTSPETRRRLSALTKRQMQSPEVRARIAASMRQVWADPEYRQRAQESHRGRQQSHATRTKRAMRGRQTASTAEGQAHLARMRAARWAKPGASERMAAITREQWQSPELRQRHAERVAKIYDGFIGPDGTVYRNVRNLEAFAREHGVKAGHLNMVFRGQRRSHKGWRRYVPEGG